MIDDKEVSVCVAYAAVRAVWETSRCWITLRRSLSFQRSILVFMYSTLARISGNPIHNDKRTLLNIHTSTYTKDKKWNYNL